MGSDLKIASALHTGNRQMAELNSVIAVFA
jgi:hypothetical protein